MPPRKERTAVVLDTNVILGHYLSRSPRSANTRIFRLWRDQRKIQLVVSEAVVAEYLEVLDRLSVPQSRLRQFAERLRRRDTVTHVNLGARFTVSRDPDDDIMLATAAAGKAKFLITNDRDLLDIPAPQQRPFKFEIIRPQGFLMQLPE